MKYKLSNDVLAGFLQLLQLAMLTETDISDHLRLLEVEPDDGAEEPKVKLTAECIARLQRSIDDLNRRAQELQAAATLAKSEA
jgi:hypothetical protein